MVREVIAKVTDVIDVRGGGTGSQMSEYSFKCKVGEEVEAPTCPLKRITGRGKPGAMINTGKLVTE